MHERASNASVIRRARSAMQCKARAEGLASSSTSPAAEDEIQQHRISEDVGSEKSMQMRDARSLLPLSCIAA